MSHVREIRKGETIREYITWLISSQKVKHWDVVQALNAFKMGVMQHPRKSTTTKIYFFKQDIV